jgi:uncharacterized protein YbcV (DUF1398 family)
MTMNPTILKEALNKTLSALSTFPEHLASLAQQGVVCYHVDFLRDEYTYYARDGQSVVFPMELDHKEVAADFSAASIDALIKRVQLGQADYPNFIREGTAAGCAYYIVFLYGGIVRYFGRDGGEHVQRFPPPLK